ncbi:GNAT family N-acetyltransferase [Vibrio rhodolitus]|uniref:GNAT family N-acetyltransferase n=1 Tax=Vibrio rhodolitus TaxID=2231649 RepID=UPI000E0BF961|nr:GNAT family N-acetyltransferase [Vibrio rhodolitus]
MTVVCETERLIVRHFALSDAPFIVRLLNQDSFIRYIADKNVRTEEDAINYLTQGPLASYAQYGFGLNLVMFKECQTPIGMCGVLKRDELEYPDLGYAFLDEFAGKGYASEAAANTLTSTMTQCELETVLAVTLLNNARSNKLLDTVGFSLQGTIELYGSLNNLYQYQTR